MHCRNFATVHRERVRSRFMGRKSWKMAMYDGDLGWTIDGVLEDKSVDGDEGGAIISKDST